MEDRNALQSLLLPLNLCVLVLQDSGFVGWAMPASLLHSSRAIAPWR
jgi:hypothetical protein